MGKTYNIDLELVKNNYDFFLETYKETYNFNARNINPPPEHQVYENKVRWRNPDGTWGVWIEIKGEKGEQGEGLHIDGAVSEIEHLPMDVDNGTVFLVNGSLYVKAASGWLLQGELVNNFIIQEKNKDNFPNIGDINSIYVDIENETVYSWNNEKNKYTIVGNNYQNIETIDGGKWLNE